MPYCNDKRRIFLCNGEAIGGYVAFSLFMFRMMYSSPGQPLPGATYGGPPTGGYGAPPTGSYGAPPTGGQYTAPLQPYQAPPPPTDMVREKSICHILHGITWSILTCVLRIQWNPSIKHPLKQGHFFFLQEKSCIQF